MRRDQLPPHKTATYVVPAWKTVYISIPKAACTSLKWLVADLNGEDPQQFLTSITRQTTRRATIHRRSLWQHTPMLHQLSDDDLAAITPDNGWFVFAVVRHPTARLWSAWQSKFLLAEPLFTERFAGAAWLPKEPFTTDSVIGRFHAFVEAIAGEAGREVMKDRHFQPQADLLALGRTPYDAIYPTARIPDLLADLDRHLRSQGWAGTLDLPRTNETPLRPLVRAFPDHVLEQIGGIYADDFDRLELFADRRPPRPSPEESYPQVLLDSIGMIRERAERVGDLAALGQDAVAHLQAVERAQAAASQRQWSRRLRRTAGVLRRRVQRRRGGVTAARTSS